jgi:RNA polymerase sigma factor (sigma-70 family)
MTRVIHELRRALLVQDAKGMSDGELLECFVSRREEAALEVLVERHAPMVWGVCRRLLQHEHDAEDAFQSAFLTFVRKAGSVKPRDTIGNWLYGVAYQTALNLRAALAKRRSREAQVTDMPEPAAPEQPTWTELRPVLDEELSRLADKHRTAIVLCDLEGKTRKEAADQLGLAEGTVASRLARARRLLAKRLTKRGLALSAEALALLVAQNALAASVPGALLCTTFKISSRLAAGAATTGLVSSHIVGLSDGVLKMMLLGKLRTLTAIALVLAMVSAGGVLFVRHLSAMQPDDGQTIALAPGKKVSEPPKKVEEPLRFDEVMLVKAKPPNLSLLYVVLTEPNAKIDKLTELVFKYARLALREATIHKFQGTTGDEKPKVEGNVVFFVRRDRLDRNGAATGFGIEQLQEILSVNPDRARQLIGRHTWMISAQPPTADWQVKQLVMETEEVRRLPPDEQKKKLPRVYRRILPGLAEIDYFALPQDPHYAKRRAERGMLSAREWVEKSWKENEMASAYLIRDAHKTCYAILQKHLDEVKPLLLADLASKNAADVKRALRDIGELRADALFDQVLAIFNGKNAELSERASLTLRDLGDPRAIPDMVKRGPKLANYSQLRSLQRGRKADPDIVAGLESADATVRERAAYALAESGDPTLVSHVIRLCADASAPVRENAANMGFNLTKDAFAKVRPSLVKLLDDPSTSVRKFTTICFVYHRDKACAKTLLQMIQDPKRTDRERFAIVPYIYQLTGTDFGYDSQNAWQPTTPANQAAIRRFAEWIKKNE